jgi:hypothetical protein
MHSKILFCGFLSLFLSLFYVVSITLYCSILLHVTYHTVSHANFMLKF